MTSGRSRTARVREALGEQKSQSEHPPLVKVESNVEEWPLFRTGRSKSDSVSTEHKIVGEDGSVLRQKLDVSAPGKYRLPGAFDYDVYSAVMELLEIRGGMPEDGTLRFSVHQLITILDINPSGKTYEDVKRSLRRIAATVLESDNAFWSKGQQRHISDTFRLWDVRFDEVSDKNGSGSRHEIEFGKLFRRSFEEQYLRGLDIDFFWNLNSPVAKRLYRLVDLKREGTASWKTDLFDLQQRIPLGPYNYVSKIKEKLAAAHEELVERRFLSDVRYRGKSGVEYVISEAFVNRRKDLELAGTREDYIAIKLLTESGLGGGVARNLVAQFGPDQCTRYANALPYQRNLRNPAGWLRRAIEEGYEVEAYPDQPTLPEAGDAETRDPAARKREREVQELQGRRKQREAGREDEEAEGDPDVPAPSPEAEAAWQALTKDLDVLRGHDALPPWWAEFEGGRLDGATLTVLVPNSAAANNLNEQFGDDLLRLWRERAGDAAVVEVAMSLFPTARREALRGSA